MDVWTVTRTILEKSPGIKRKELLPLVMKKTGLGQSAICEHWTSLEVRGKIYREKGRYYLEAPSKAARPYTVVLSEEQRQSLVRVLLGAQRGAAEPAVLSKAPRVHFHVTQQIVGHTAQRQLPVVGFNIYNLNEYPMRLRVEARTFLGGKKLGLVQDRRGYYSGEREWLLDPFSAVINGNFPIQAECQQSREELTIEVQVIATDEHGNWQQLSPKSWTYKRDTNSWFYEPSALTSGK